MESHTRGNGAGGVEFVGRALEILRWGNKTWEYVPQDDKGAIFSDSFMYGVHGLYLGVLMQVRIMSSFCSAIMCTEHMHRPAAGIKKSIWTCFTKRRRHCCAVTYPTYRPFSVVGLWRRLQHILVELHSRASGLPAGIRHSDADTTITEWSDFTTLRQPRN